MWLLVVRIWRFNERYYGGLIGFNKVEIVVKYGEVQVKIWRRFYDVLLFSMEFDYFFYSNISKVWINRDLVYFIYDLGIRIQVLFFFQFLLVFVQFY